MIEQQENLPGILMVSEPFFEDAPHSAIQSSEALALKLSAYFDVSLLTFVFAKGVNENYKPLVRTENNFTRIKIVIKDSNCRFIRKYRKYIACRAGLKVFERESVSPVAVVAYGVDSLSVLYKKQRFGNASAFAVINRIPEERQNVLIKKISGRVQKFLFLSAELKEHFVSIGLPDTGSEILPLSVDSSVISDVVGNREGVLMVLNNSEVEYLNLFKKQLNVLFSEWPETTVKISAVEKQKLSVSFTGRNISYIDSYEEFIDEVPKSGLIIVSGEYYKTVGTVAVLIATGNNVLFFTNHIPADFPFAEYCVAVSAEVWDKTGEIIKENINKTIARSDAGEYVNDNFSPEVAAFAIKNLVEQNINNERGKK